MTSVPMPASPTRRHYSRAAEGTFRLLCGFAATLTLAALSGIIISLAIGGWPALSKFGLAFLTTSTWNPVTEVFGAAGPIVGTLLTSAIALGVGLPIAFGVAIFLVEFCPPLLRRPLGIAVELLAGIPSIVYGMWGLFVLAPWFAMNVQIPLMSAAPPGSIWEALTFGIPNGANILTASLVLAIMILPYLAAVLRDLLLTIPPVMREGAYALGATPFEAVTGVSLPYISGSAVGAVMLGFGRALGETMAVTFIIGNAHGFPKNLFDSGSTISSTIANEFNEATGAMHVSSLIALGFLLFVLTFAILAVARVLIGKTRDV